MTIRIALADDHRIIREGVRLMLAAEPNMVIVGEAEDGVALLDLLDEQPVDVVVLDIRMPGMNGFETLKQLKADHPATKVVILTMYDDSSYVRRAVELGASAYLLKSADKSEIMRAVLAAADGKAYVQADLTQDLVRAAIAGPSTVEEPSDTQLSVLRLVSRGYDNPSIATALELTEGQVRRCLRSLFDQLGVHTRAEAVAEAFRRGYLT